MPMYAVQRRVQTAFRLDEMLVRRLKKKAADEGKSLNKLVEDTLTAVAPPKELDWPQISLPQELDPRVKDLGLSCRPFTEEELKEDERLAYILSK